MKKLAVIVEGQTEREFVSTSLIPYLQRFNISSVYVYPITTSHGGLTNYNHFKKDILNEIFNSHTLVTTLIDYYALPHDFPKYDDHKALRTKRERVEFLESAIKEEIEIDKGRSFPNLIPYIQLHEFEALVFSSRKAFDELFTEDEADFEEIKNILDKYPNPEDINDNRKSAPSKRLLKLIHGYDKVVYGNLLIEEIGIDKILEKCPRFKEWIEKIKSQFAT